MLSKAASQLVGKRMLIIQSLIPRLYPSVQHVLHEITWTRPVLCRKDTELNSQG